jgi:hypothetical protein
MSRRRLRLRSWASPGRIAGRSALGYSQDIPLTKECAMEILINYCTE